MGLFDFLFRRSDRVVDDDLESAASPAGPRMPSPSEWEDMNSPDRIRWIGTELEQVKAACDKAGVRVNPELLEAELRGNLRGRPVAVKLDDDGSVDLLVKFVNRRGHLIIGPPQARPEGGDDGEFWDDNNDVVTPEIAPGLAITAFRSDLPAFQASWDSLDAAGRERLVAATTLGVSHIRIEHQRLEAVSIVGPAYQIPVASTLRAQLDALVAVAESFSEGAAPITPRHPNTAGAALPEKIVCSYCGTTFFVEIGDTRCPACGANK
jgi:hypothetical protein